MDVCGITISSRQYDEIAERMGEGEQALPLSTSPSLHFRFFAHIIIAARTGFTAEALKHRFRKIKAQAGTGGSKSGGSSPRKAATPKANKTTDAASKSSNKTPRSSTLKRNAKNYAEPVTDEEDAEEEKIPESPTKKIKKEQKEDDEVEDSGTGAAESYFDAQPEQV
ncbi:hypothetical protein DIS24_g8918 [Lasiodiplodia hormozganensis]|uniref:Uncharacterized protein n=1 Tax=Lasiodiplodia hormozganensis TaxID=869390 RepID=A0AA40CL95_9PEZI|nr:hypothetical protein DIS24_g8918 [Lasiodiplodia hormozganensis]